MKVNPGMEDSPVLVFDIETRQTTNPNVIEQLTIAATDQRPAHNTAKALKESWDSPEAIEARVKAALRKTSLDPFLAEVACVGWSRVHGGRLVTDSMVSYDDQSGEKELLLYIAYQWDSGSLHEPGEVVWCGHNIKNFDLPILTNRMRRYRITPPDTFPRWTGRYWRGRVHDTMEHVAGRNMVSCVNACAYYGIKRSPVCWQPDPDGPEVEINGSMVQQLVDADEWDLLRRYCLGDVLDEFALYCVQTSNEQRPSYDIESGGLDSVMREIDEADGLSNGAKWLTARAALKSAGVLK